MPVYLFRHPLTGAIRAVVQKMAEPHEFRLDGITYERVFLAPNATIDAKIDPFNQKEFSRKTRETRGRLGDLMDRSQEMSEKRKDKLGYDPVKNTYHKNWSKKRKGKPHPDTVKTVFEI